MKILIADDHDLLRDVLCSYLETVGGFATRTASDVEGALELVDREGPFDVILLDFNMPGMNGFDGLRRALDKSAGGAVAIMSGTAPRAAAEEALSIGASGFLPKTLPAKSLVNAVRFMASGERYAPVDFVTDRSEPTEPLAGAGGTLSPRERQVLEGLCAGRANKEIARDLGLSEPTIKLHVKSICRKLGARNRTHAAMIARDAAPSPN